MNVKVEQNDEVLQSFASAKHGDKDMNSKHESIRENGEKNSHNLDP